MTNEEATMILKNEQPHCGKRALFPEEKKYEAYEMAIKALEQQTCEDAVSREVVLEVLKDKWNAFSDANDAMQESIDTIEALPPVNPQRTGHWIKYGKLYQCSECKELSCCQGKFCNECGAKMVEPQESEDEDVEYQRQTEQLEHDILYEPTFNPEDGSM